MKTSTTRLLAALSLAALGATAFVANDAISAKPGSGEPAGRFIVLSEFNDQAVQDTMTGLMWERNPDLTIVSANVAIAHCGMRQVGDGRLGWRLPTQGEMGSLLDMNSPVPRLQAGHPFGPTSTVLWTSFSYGSGAYGYYQLNDYNAGLLWFGGGSGQLATPWCVRSDL